MKVKIIYWGLFIFTFLFLTGCFESGVKAKNSKSSSQLTSTDDTNHVDNTDTSTGTCTVGQSEQVDCTNEKYGAAKATMLKNCVDTSNGPMLISGSCLIDSCVSGSVLINNYCVVNTCAGGSAQSCAIQNGSGIQSRTCASGVWSDWGACTVQSCNTGYVPSANTCVLSGCTGATNQACSVANGIGSQSRTCNNGAWSAWGACVAQSCNTGYRLENNTCLTNVCTGSTSQACGVTNGVGIQNRTCTNGVWSAFGSCTVTSCNQGYHLENNKCLTNVCTGSTSQACGITNGVGIQNRTCTNGVWSAFGGCLVSSCNSGYVKSGNTCTPTVCSGLSTQSCTVTNGIGGQARTCNLGVWSAWGACTVQSCNQGYRLENNACVLPTCAGENTQVCGVQNGMGHQIRTCNNGTWSAWGACIAQTCNQGYQLVGGLCSAMVCIGDATRACSENHGSGMQTRECSLGVWSNWGTCAISSCDAGYRFENNVCILNVCEGDSARTCTVSNGTGVQSRTCTNGVWSAYSSCKASFCNSGYVVQNGICVAVECVGNSAFACYVENGIGVQTRYCNLGQWSDYGDCTATSCNNGFSLVANSCRPTTCGGISSRSCSATNGIGIQSRTCNNGVWSAYGVCKAVKCNSNAELINGSCVIKTCLESNTQSCSDSTGSGIQVRSCTNGIWGPYGECLKEKCVAGYEVKNQQCVPVTCQNLSTQMCSVENGTGMQKHFCQNGVWSSWGPCVLKECAGVNNTDYLMDVTNNRCICSVYATQSCTGVHGSGIRTRSCQNNVWSAYSVCQLYYCESGYTLNAANNTCDPN